MKEFNFNTIKNLPVPEQWIENALVIPETEEQSPAVVPLSNGHCEESAEPMTRQSQPFWRKPRFIAMAATLVLVTALSIALFLSMGNKPPTSVKPDSDPDSTQIVWSTDEYGATIATEVIVVPDAQNDDQTADQKPGIVRLFEKLFGVTDPTTPPSGSDPSGRGRVSSTAKPGGSGSGSSAPTEKQSPSQGGSSITPTEPSQDDPTPIDQPTDTPWEDPTTTPWEGSTIAPTEQPWENPTEASWIPPTYTPTPPKPTQNPYKSTIINTFSPFSNQFITGQTIYCRVYGLDGSEYGDSNRYSAQHIAVVSYSGDRYTATYSPSAYGILPANGKYRYEFYNGNGRVISQGTATLSAS